MAEISNAQVALNASTATLCVTADQDGCGVIVHNVSGVVVYLGDSAVTSSTGFALDKDAGPVQFKLPPQATLYAIAASGTPALSVLKIGNN